MPNNPILILPRYTPSPRIPRKLQVKSHLRMPPRDDQGRVIGPQLTSMLDAFLSDAPSGTSTENILVLETFGRPEGFRAAVSAISGLKWLAEIDIDDIEADDRFFEKPKIGKRFLKDNVVGLDMTDSRNIFSAFKDRGRPCQVFS